MTGVQTCALPISQANNLVVPTRVLTRARARVELKDVDQGEVLGFRVDDENTWKCGFGFLSYLQVKQSGFYR